MTEPGNGSLPEGSAATAVAVAVSRRARAAMKSLASAGSARSSESTTAGPSEGLLAGLRHHLLAGETHYPDRPGMGELRRRVGEALPDVGLPAREPDGVLITQGEGESLFATILGLGGGEGATIVAQPGSRHQRLLDWMRVRVIEPGTDAASEAEAAFHLIEHEAGAGTPGSDSASEAPGLVQVHAIGDRLFGGLGYEAGVPSSSGESGGRRPSAESAGAPADAIVIGSLDGLEGMHPFSLGFVAAPVAVRPRIAKWKQASSICSPAPSQRAALWALGVRP